MTNQELLKHLIEFFPVVGHVMGKQELKYNVIMKYADLPKDEQKEKLEELDDLLEELIDREIINQFEFNDTINYKAQQEIPINLNGGESVASEPSGDGDGTKSDQMSALSDLVVALAESSDNPQVQSLLDSYKADYM